MIDKIGGPEGIRTLDLFHAMEAGSNNLGVALLETKAEVAGLVSGSVPDTYCPGYENGKPIVPWDKAGPILPVNVPTALTAAEADELYRLARGRTVLEFGSLLGYSTIVLAQSANVVYAVDPHHGYPVANPRDTLATFMANLQANLVSDRVVPIIARGQDVAPILKPGEFDLVFIDITCAAEVLLYTALRLAPDVIAVHDYGIPKWTGATEAVDDFARKYRRTFRLVDTLAVFELRS